MPGENKAPSFSNMPDAVILLVLSCLNIQEHSVVAQVSQSLRTLSADHFLWNCLLKSDFRTTIPGAAKRIFLENPAARAKYASFDQAGKTYLSELIEQRIQEHGLTPVQADNLRSGQFSANWLWTQVNTEAIERQIAQRIEATSPQQMQGFSEAQVRGVRSGLAPGETQHPWYREHPDYFIEHGCSPKFL